jgi:hypothetical protein
LKLKLNDLQICNWRSIVVARPDDGRKDHPIHYVGGYLYVAVVTEKGEVMECGLRKYMVRKYMARKQNSVWTASLDSHL